MRGAEVTTLHRKGEELHCEVSSLSLDWERKSRIYALLLVLKHVATFGHRLGSSFIICKMDDKVFPSLAQAEVQLHT